MEEIVDPRSGARVPRVIVDVVLGSHTSNRYIDMAIEYIRYNVERVIIFKLFPIDHLALVVGLWEIRAMVIVFGLTDPTNRASRVRIFETQSFGNDGVAATSTRTLCGLSTRSGIPVEIPDLEPLKYESAVALLKTGCRREIRAHCVAQDLLSIRQLQLPFEVALPAPLNSVSFDLVSVFASAVIGLRGDLDGLHARQKSIEEAEVAALWEPMPDF